MLILGIVGGDAVAVVVTAAVVEGTRAEEVCSKEVVVDGGNVVDACSEAALKNPSNRTTWGSLSFIVPDV